MSDAALRQGTSAEAPAAEAPAKGKKGSPLKKLLLLGIGCAIVIGAGKYGTDWWQTGRFIETTDDAYVGGNVTPIAPHVAGFVDEILVEDNAHVEAGQVLVKLDRRDVDTARAHAKALLDARLAALVNLRAQYVLQQAAIDQATADVSAKKARREFARIEGERYATLASSAAGSRQDAERTVAVRAEADAAALSSAAGLEAAKQQLRVLDAKVVEAEAMIEQARSDLAAAELNQVYTEIHAPMSGYVANRAAQKGAFVGIGTYLLSIVPDKGLWVDANFKEDQLAHMVPGQTATIAADIASGTLRGHVVSLARGTGSVFSVIPAENATGNFTKIVQRVPVRIVIDGGDPAVIAHLRPGLSTLASVDTKSKP